MLQVLQEESLNIKPEKAETNTGNLGLKGKRNSTLLEVSGYQILQEGLRRTAQGSRQSSAGRRAGRSLPGSSAAARGALPGPARPRGAPRPFAKRRCGPAEPGIPAPAFPPPAPARPGRPRSAAPPERPVPEAPSGEAARGGGVSLPPSLPPPPPTARSRAPGAAAALARTRAGSRRIPLPPGSAGPDAQLRGGPSAPGNPPPAPPRAPAIGQRGRPSYRARLSLGSGHVAQTNPRLPPPPKPPGGGDAQQGPPAPPARRPFRFQPAPPPFSSPPIGAGTCLSHRPRPCPGELSVRRGPTPLPALIGRQCRHSTPRPHPRRREGELLAAAERSAPPPARRRAPSGVARCCCCRRSGACLPPPPPAAAVASRAPAQSRRLALPSPLLSAARAGPRGTGGKDRARGGGGGSGGSLPGGPCPGSLPGGAERGAPARLGTGPSGAAAGEARPERLRLRSRGGGGGARWVWGGGAGRASPAGRGGTVCRGSPPACPGGRRGSAAGPGAARPPGGSRAGGRAAGPRPPPRRGAPEAGGTVGVGAAPRAFPAGAVGPAAAAEGPCVSPHQVRAAPAGGRAVLMSLGHRAPWPPPAGFLAGGRFSYAFRT
ncbi:basic proline-rich protein-like [Apus apus]|uniref:basic proline-rich protein-like n=1 Tax=Apus apus TaxID=8895 RepID=UPI0021F84ED3|nr:basic proline-rich protein-like [Apus apus]